uniref:polynucleotide adenylyltransferase n=1 Tax=Kalanchoe fedtschenkoi TaxID=63787 RepID=A0A7N0UQW9_KALFE
MEPDPPLYDTLNPLDTQITRDADEADVVVFRNEISGSSPPSAPTGDFLAPDYFSLDLEDNDFRTPSPSPSPARLQEPETTIETGWFQGNSGLKSPMLQLHKEILDFCEFLSPTAQEKAARDAAVKGVFDVIRHIWPLCNVQVFGSFRTGLYLPTSDIDVVILDSDIRTPQLGLRALSRALSQRGIAKNIQVIAKARVPIIKFVERSSGVAFDISFDAQNGPKAADFIQAAVSKLPPLRPLCLILKVFLQQRELNEVYSGGIGSYALLAMLIAMLQSRHESHTSSEQNLGVLLINFFDMYGRKLNTSDVGVSCSVRGTFFSKKVKGFLNKDRPFLISIEDPQALENDIGKNSYNYFQIRSAFSMAFSSLTNAKTILGLGPSRSILGTIIRPDRVLLERKGGSNGEMTFKRLLPGAGELVELHYGDPQMLCNWQMDDAEEPLPRGNGTEIQNGEGSSGRKRKSVSNSIEDKRKKRKAKYEENGLSKEKREKRKTRLKESGTSNGSGSRKKWKRKHRGGDEDENYPSAGVR